MAITAEKGFTTVISIGSTFGNDVGAPCGIDEKFSGGGGGNVLGVVGDEVEIILEARVARQTTLVT
ncbi:hypothetical protein AGMMS49950_02500 [Endomicrobiia bacterium]|nr:hypothetical protein AGMMS49950_02500 [Endomicrobiia bacterium]